MPGLSRKRTAPGGRVKESAAVMLPRLKWSCRRARPAGSRPSSVAGRRQPTSRLRPLTLLSSQVQATSPAPPSAEANPVMLLTGKGGLGRCDRVAHCNAQASWQQARGGGACAALAREYAGPGVTLFLGGRDTGRLGAVSRACAARGTKAYATALDVTDADACA